MINISLECSNVQDLRAIKDMFVESYKEVEFLEAEIDKLKKENKKLKEKLNTIKENEDGK